MTTNSCWPAAESWYRYWPAGIVAAIGVIQLLISFIVVVIHAAIVGIGVGVFCFGAGSWIIMGFVCWGIFLACWISVFCVTCCNRSSPGCATYAMIKNILAFIFAAVLIDFDRKFIDGQYSLTEIGSSTDCALLSGSLGNYASLLGSVNSGSYASLLGSLNSGSYASLLGSGKSSDYGTLLNALKGLAKGQLAGSVLILVSALVFIAIYIYVFIRALQGDGRVSGSLPFPRQFVSGPEYVPPVHHPPPRLAVPPPQPIPMVVHKPAPSYNPNIVVCDNCGAAVQIPERF